MVMDEIWALQDKKKGAAMVETNLIQRELELEVKLRQSSECLIAAKGREEAVKKELATVKEELAISCMECGNLWRGRNEIVVRTQQANPIRSRRLR